MSYELLAISCELWIYRSYLIEISSSRPRLTTAWTICRNLGAGREGGLEFTQIARGTGDSLAFEEDTITAS
jgi:hypothetical protein